MFDLDVDLNSGIAEKCMRIRNSNIYEWMKLLFKYHLCESQGMKSSVDVISNFYCNIPTRSEQPLWSREGNPDEH